MLTKLEKIAFVCDVADLRNRLRLSPDFDEELQPMIDHTLAVVNPKVLFRRVPVRREDGALFLGDLPVDSRLVKNRLADVSEVFAYVATCGTEADALMLAKTDPVEEMWQGELNVMAMQAAVKAAVSHLQQEYGLHAVRAVNPGSIPDFPIQYQRGLFELLGDVQGEIGVTLTDSLLMMPIKTTSGFWFASKDEYANCMVCLRENCQGRRAPFDQKMFNEIFASGNENV